MEFSRSNPRASPSRSSRSRTVGSNILTIVLATIAFIVLLLAANKWRHREVSPAKSQATSREDGAVQNPNDDSAKRFPLFADVTKEAGIAFTHVFGEKREWLLPEQIGSGGAFFDYDGDNDLDVYLIQSGHLDRDDPLLRNALYRNDGEGRFSDVSIGSGADIGGYGMGCAAADYDSDGDVDLLVTRLGSCALLRNEGGGKFKDVTVEAGIAIDGFPASAAFLDIDRDGLLDFYVTRYVDWRASRESTCYAGSGVRDYCGPLTYKSPSEDRLYRNLGGGQFQDVSTSSGIAAAKGNGLGVLASDFDGDGWVDIYVANDQTPAFLWFNQKDGTFRERAALSGAAFSADGLAIAGMGVVSEDLDADADFDLLITNIRDQPHLCLQNDGGLFQDVTHSMGFGGWSLQPTGFGVALFDQDNNGQWDGFVANGAVNVWGKPYHENDPYAEPNQFFRRDSSGRFQDATVEAGPAVASVGVSRAALMGDYDNDGNMDILVTNNGGPAQLLRNLNQSGLSWVHLDLIPEGGGRHALNAHIRLTAEGRTYLREVRPNSGYLGSNDPRVHFGLGRVERVDQIEVTWPDGRMERWNGLPVKRILELRQGRKEWVERRCETAQ